MAIKFRKSKKIDQGVTVMNIHNGATGKKVSQFCRLRVINNTGQPTTFSGPFFITKSGKQAAYVPAVGTPWPGVTYVQAGAYVDYLFPDLTNQTTARATWADLVSGGMLDINGRKFKMPKKEFKILKDYMS